MTLIMKYLPLARICPLPTGATQDRGDTATRDPKQYAGAFGELAVETKRKGSPRCCWQIVIQIASTQHPGGDAIRKWFGSQLETGENNTMVNGGGLGRLDSTGSGMRLHSSLKCRRFSR